MYLSHFGFTEWPFANTPDPRFVYLSPRHEEALAHLLYGVRERGGFVQLTGEVGTGKTTICRYLLSQVPMGVDIALVLNPMLTPEELLATVCDELGGAHAQGLRRRALSPPAGRARPGAAHGAHHRRGAEPQRGRARATTAAHQPRDRDREAAADHPHRPAGAHGAARAARPAAGGATDHRPLPPPAVQRAGHARLRLASAADRRAADLAVRAGGAGSGASGLPGRATAHQRGLRPRAARRLCRGQADGERAHGAPRGSRG